MEVETLEPVHAAVVPVGRRLLIGLLWGVTQIVIVFVLWYVCVVAAAYLGQAITGSPMAALAGMPVGAAAGVFVDHKARAWVQESRLRRLRAGGVSARGVVRKLDRVWQPSGRGGGLTRYVAHVEWQDPVTGAHWQGERRYRFYDRGSRQLEAICANGAQVDLYYPTNRPSRFIIDVPFAPTMADVLG